MLRKKWPRRVIGDDFEIRVGGRGSILYLENEKNIEVNSEYSYDGCIVVYESYIRKWDFPYDNEIIDDVKRNKILKNIKDALQFRKVNIEIQP